ncbi:hypothetical protein CHN50_15230 [Priestia aryabhattai]|nr:hypothetical protein CHN50_15230 [Priestia aryabhattai]
MEAYFSKQFDKEEFTFVYQPIYCVNKWSKVGFEALLRLQSSHAPIIDLFLQAHEDEKLAELDMMAIEGAIDCFPFEILQGKKLFVNLFPSTVIDKQFHFFIQHLLVMYPNSFKRVVFELNESTFEHNIWSSPLFKEGLSYLRQCGFQIAIDDVGTGMGSLQHVVEHRPDIIKLDGYFSKGLAHSKEKQEMVKCLSQYNEGNTTLILEGIECEKDLAIVLTLDIKVVQGYLLDRPAAIDTFLKNHQLRESLSFGGIR